MSKAFLLAKEKYQAVIDDAGRGDFAEPTALAPLGTLRAETAIPLTGSIILNSVAGVARR
ncbi:hypothetical protein F4805DRAFT_216607 [Annulohypoxylon moriforme]|nr:hypothetical protein F4805DRAFT_216607 [Annulohypoxylon moriforme]